MPGFFGRAHELDQLQQLTRKGSASLAVVTGRRRIGKSRLVEEFARRCKGYNRVFIEGLAPAKGITPRSQKQEFARQMERSLSIPPVVAEDWGDLFEHLASRTRHGRWIILLDEVTWMGSRDPEFLPKLKTAWDLHFKNNPQLILILCGSVSGWIERNLLSSTGFLGRVSLRLHVPQLPVRDCHGFWAISRQHVSFYEELKILAVTGGVPRYLEEVIPALPADENIGRLCFQREGMLFHEFDHIFSDLFSSRGEIYKRIVAHLARGSSDMKGIFRALRLEKGGVLSAYLDDLALAGFVARDFTWSLKTLGTSKLSRFRLCDNYLRFYLRYIRPNRERIAKGRFVHKPAEALPGWDAVMGLQFENLVLENRTFLWRQCGLSPAEIAQEGPFVQTRAGSRAGCQIDYLIQSRYGPLYLCEIKFRRSPLGMGVIREVQQKVRRLKTPRHASVIPVLVHVNGVTAPVEHSGFFAHVIDFAAILED
jgi:hypothetical protein